MKRIIFLLIILVLIPVCHVSAQAKVVLTLALYPYVPDLSRFKSAISEEWEKRHPEVQLKFSDWDCYSETLPENADVFVYDTVYMNNYLKQGLLLPLTWNDAKNIDDIFPFVMDSCTVDEVIYAIPKFLCSEFLYTRKSDTELDDIENIRELYDVIGDLAPEEGLLPMNEGLLVSIPSNMNASFWLVQALVDAEQADLSVLFPLDPEKIPQAAADSLWMIRDMAGFEDMTLKTDNNGPYIFGEWFTDGEGVNI
ncbi:MAG: thiamine pyridinylase [Anaerolineaceae bacterium]|nr:thiamine pyridinylase [Anaerolineaceae bacterium]